MPPPGRLGRAWSGGLEALHAAAPVLGHPRSGGLRLRPRTGDGARQPTADCVKAGPLALRGAAAAAGRGGGGGGRREEHPWQGAHGARARRAAGGRAGDPGGKGGAGEAGVAGGRPGGSPRGWGECGVGPI